tara:strand:+ start:116 stop:385 length:270 start_codon:yes stop_codon:yes gene_type:complete
MNYEIEIDSKDDELVIFYIEDTPYEVEIDTEIGTETYPVSFNSFSDKITYAEADTIYYRVKEETLYCDGVCYYDTSDLCKQLEQILNNG